MECVEYHVDSIATKVLNTGYTAVKQASYAIKYDMLYVVEKD